MNAFERVSRPVRAAGIALIGLAVVAAVFGGVTLLTGNGSESAAPSSENGPGGVPVPPGETSQGPGGTSAPDDGQPSAPAPGEPGGEPAPAPGEPGGPAPAPGQPGGAPLPGQPGGQPGQPVPGEPGGQQGGVAGQPGNQQAAAKWVVVRVYNNSNIKGLAEKATEDLRTQGWNVAETSNYSAGIIPTTTAYFRPGTDEETAAKALAAGYGMRAEPRFDGIQDSSEGVIVIVTNDYKGDSGKS